MGKNQEPLKVTCPCCKAKLSVDAALGVVLSHEEPPRRGPDVDLTNAAGILSEQQRQREDKFADSPRTPPPASPSAISISTESSVSSVL